MKVERHIVGSLIRDVGDELGVFSLEVYRKISPRKATLLQGLPGLGLVGKLAVEMLIEHFSAEPVARLYSEYMFLPDGNVGVGISNGKELSYITIDFYYAATSSGEELILMTAQTQPVNWGQYRTLQKVLDLARSWRVRRVVSLGGFAMDRVGEEREAYVAASSKALLREFTKCGAKVLRGGYVTGACGLIVGLAAISDFESATLLGVTHGKYPDPRGAKAVIDVLDKMYKIDFRTEIVERKIKEVEKTLKLTREMKEIVSRRGEAIQRPEYPYTV